MLRIEPAQGLRLAARADWRVLGAITAEAFAEDPVATWTFDGKPCLTPVFQRLARDVYLPRGICHLADGDTGATMWRRRGRARSWRRCPCWARRPGCWSTAAPRR